MSLIFPSLTELKLGQVKNQVRFNIMEIGYIFKVVQQVLYLEVIMDMIDG